MKKLVVCSVLLLAGLFACVDSKDEDESKVESAVLCCIDFTCPAPEPYDFTTTGCRTGAGPSIAEARAECEAGCPVMCQSSGLYCQ